MEPKMKYPWWVRQSLYRMHSRRSLEWLQWIGYGLGACILIYMTMNGRFSEGGFWVFGILGLLVGRIYQVSIRWMDRHGDWNRIRENWASSTEVVMAIVLGLCAGGAIRSFF